MTQVMTLDMDQVDLIVANEMASLIKNFTRDLEAIRAGKNVLATFDSDPDLEQLHIMEHIDAFKLVLEWVGNPEELQADIFNSERLGELLNG